MRYEGDRVAFGQICRRRFAGKDKKCFSFNYIYPDLVQLLTSPKG